MVNKKQNNNKYEKRFNELISQTDIFYDSLDEGDEYDEYDEELMEQQLV